MPIPFDVPTDSGILTSFPLVSTINSMTSSAAAPPVAANLMLSHSSKDFTNDARSIVSKALSKIPVAGFFLSSLELLLWPVSKDDVWKSIKDKVESVINSRIADFQYQLIQEDLTGLGNVIRDYRNALQFAKSNPSYLTQKYNFAVGLFESQQPHFMAAGEEVPLLGLLAQFANLHLALLRDGSALGTQWGWTPAVAQQQQTKLTTAIQKYTHWVDKWYEQGFQNLKLPTSGEHLQTRRWAIQNKYHRELTFTVMDFRHFWPYFDPTQKGPVPELTRTIFSDPIGTFDNGGIPKLTPPTEDLLVAMAIRGYALVDGFSQTFVDRSGGIYTTYSGGSGGRGNPPLGWHGHFDNNLLVRVWGRSGDVVNAMQFQFKNGEQTNRVGNNQGPQYGTPYDFSYKDHVVTKMYGSGISPAYKTIECVILGFRLEHNFASWKHL